MVMALNRRLSQNLFLGMQPYLPHESIDVKKQASNSHYCNAHDKCCVTVKASRQVQAKADAQK